MRYFLALADERDAKRAARLCGLTPSLLGRHIVDLEESLGCSLFRRGASRLSLTAAGQVFYERSKELLASAAKAAGEARAVAAAPVSEIRVGHYGEWWKKRYASGLRRYSRESPDVRLHEACYEPSAVLDALKEGEVDMALLEEVDLGLRIDFNIRRLELRPAVVVLPSGHRHARRRWVSFADLREEVWVAWDERTFPGRRNRLLAAAQKAHFRPCIASDEQSEDGVFAQVSFSNAVGYLPAGLHGTPPEGVALVSLKPAVIEFPVYLAWRKDATLIEQLDLFASILLGDHEWGAGPGCSS